LTQAIVGKLEQLAVFFVYKDPKNVTAFFEFINANIPISLNPKMKTAKFVAGLALGALLSQIKVVVAEIFKKASQSQR
jgi:hypothetical protein